MRVAKVRGGVYELRDDLSWDGPAGVVLDSLNALVPIAQFSLAVGNPRDYVFTRVLGMFPQEEVEVIVQERSADETTKRGRVY